MLKRASRCRETQRELSLQHAAPLITTESFRQLFFCNKDSNKSTVHFQASTKQQADKVSGASSTSRAEYLPQELLDIRTVFWFYNHLLSFTAFSKKSLSIFTHACSLFVGWLVSQRDLAPKYMYRHTRENITTLLSTSIAIAWHGEAYFAYLYAIANHNTNCMCCQR